jgi:hypothetical protein
MSVSSAATNLDNSTLYIDAGYTHTNQLYYTSLYSPSDEKYKKNVTTLSNSFSQLSKLRAITYELDLSNSSYMKPKEIDIPGYGKYKTEMAPYVPDGRKHIGFSAQELQKVFPALVTSDEDGNLYVDYVSLIPVIVEALKEQSAVVTAQSGKIKELENKLTATTGEAVIAKTAFPAAKLATETTANETANAFLYQNAPNPFNTATTIRYFLSSEAANAALYLFDMQGKLVDSYPIGGAGEGSIEISASGLQPGMYLYSLLVNNQEVDTKRMVITE